jgi:integrase
MMLYKRGDHWHLDATVDGVRYRVALETTDKREATARAQDKIAAIKAGKVAAVSGREFARLPFTDAVALYQQQRGGKVAERTTQFEAERLKPLIKFFGGRTLRTIKPEDVAAYQQARRQEVAGRTVNMETGVLRRVLKKRKLYSVLADYPAPFPETEREVGKVLTQEQKLHLFKVASENEDWLVCYCAAVLAAWTTCRGVELRNLRWRDVDLMNKTVTVRRSKTAAGQRVIPLVDEAVSALVKLQARSEALVGSAEPDHYVFPACESSDVDPTRFQKGWRTAWRSLVAEAAKQAGDAAAEAVLERRGDTEQARAEAERARAAAIKPYIGVDGARLRFHDLRHQGVTELCEAGVPDSVVQAIAGHMSKKMQDHYSHVRLEAKRKALESLTGGLMRPPLQRPETLETVPGAKVN